MELKSRSFTTKEPHVARESQVADPCLLADSLFSANFVIFKETESSRS